MTTATDQETAYGINSMKEIVDIENHIGFLNALLKKYQWNKDVRKKIISDLSFIEHKKNDKTLHLSVVGEFSSGKSTFINALLRDDLLEADIIQGTTVASTVIRYAPKYAVIINFKDGRQETFNEENVSSEIPGGIRGVISNLTTNGQLAEKIKEVIIEHPAAALSNGISIIDTPGTNSDERWHEDVTKTAIRDTSDVSIILTSAEQPLPDTLNAFVRQNLGDVVERCVFVVTKMDLVREKERERQLSYIKQKITSTFGIQKPAVFPYTPLFVLGEASPEVKKDIGYKKNDYAALVEQSYQTETQFYRILSEQRIIIQVKKLLSVMDSTFTYISDDMQSMSAQHKKSHKALSKAAKRDLGDFADEMEEKYCDAFCTKANNGKQEILNDVYAYIENEKGNIKSAFNDCSTSSALTTFKDGLPGLLKQASDNITAAARDKYERIGKTASRQMKAFWEEFQRLYKELDALEIEKAPNFNTKEISVPASLLYNQSAIDNALSAYVKQEDFVFWGSTAGGAAIGTAILPGVGTVIGGLVGLFFGASQTEKKLEEFKSNASTGIGLAMNDYFNDIVSAIDADIDSYIKENEQHIKDQIAECVKEYKQLVDRMIVKNNQRKRKLETNITALQQDLSEIENRKYKIKSLGQRLGGM